MTYAAASIRGEVHLQPSLCVFSTRGLAALTGKQASSVRQSMCGARLQHNLVHVLRKGGVLAEHEQDDQQHVHLSRGGGEEKRFDAICPVSGKLQR